MGGTGDSRRGQRCIDAAAKARFVEALRGGAALEDAAFDAGFSLQGFYGSRRRDPAFAAAWVEALASSAAAERRVRAYAQRGACPGPDRGEGRIVSANRRIYQRRHLRNVRFDARAQEVFLKHFAATCDMRAAAVAAGVSEATVKLHRRNDPAFAAAFDQALQEGYVALEAETVRQRLAAQRRLRAAVEAAPHDRPPPFVADAGAEFERVMKLLARWDRRGRGPGFREVRHGRRKRMSFDDAIRLLDKKLRAMGVRRTGGSAE